MISKLPFFVSFELLCHWLEIGDLMKFDHSWCNHAKRKCFLSILNNPHFTIHDNEVYDCNLSYVLSRKLWLKNVDFDQEGLCKYLKQNPQKHKIVQLTLHLSSDDPKIPLISETELVN